LPASGVVSPVVSFPPCHSERSEESLSLAADLEGFLGPCGPSE
jgi:hypothetical protein